jgi:hypothetical protein
MRCSTSCGLTERCPVVVALDDVNGSTVVGGVDCLRLCGMADRRACHPRHDIAVPSRAFPEERRVSLGPLSSELHRLLEERLA